MTPVAGKKCQIWETDEPIVV